MKIQDQVCTASQAEKLKQLGITAPSLHIWHKLKFPASEEGFAKRRANCLITPTGDNIDRFIMHYIDDEHASFHWEEGTHDGGQDHSRCEIDDDGYPAYTVAELGQMLPDEYLRNDIDKDFEMQHGRGVWPTGTNWGARFERSSGGTEFFPTEAQARAHLLIHLLESKLTTPEETNKRLTHC